MKRFQILICVALLLFGCAAGARAAENGFVLKAADAYLSRIPELQGVAADDFAKVEAVYRRLIETTTFGEPVGLDVWRWRGDGEEPPSYLECRAISPLLFGVGSCEDYAGTMAVLLRRLGYPAEYIPGLTISVEGKWVEHAWTAVRIQGEWYHLDAQLEDNVTKNKTLAYRFFLKTDAEMARDHRWGVNWLRYGQSEKGPLTSEQVEQIREIYTPPPCVKEYPSPAPRRIVPNEKAVRDNITASLKKEAAFWGEGHAVTIRAAAPVFGALPAPDACVLASSVLG